ncbi:hypothetical protein MHTCC0001_35570 [Flavobacteriaceae bacterium MHTCC 0001]
MKKIIISIVVVMFSLSIYSQDLRIKFDDMSNVEISTPEVNNLKPFKVFLFKSNHSCGDFEIFHHRNKTEKREITLSEFNSLTSNATNLKTTIFDQFKYCSEILEELNKYDKVYLLVQEGDKYYEYEVKYRFTRVYK